MTFLVLMRLKPNQNNVFLYVFADVNDCAGQCENGGTCVVSKLREINLFPTSRIKMTSRGIVGLGDPDVWTDRRSDICISQCLSLAYLFPGERHEHGECT